MKTAVRNIILVILTCHLSGCERILIGPDPVNTPVNNFEILWKTIDEKYALFPYKEIDWDSIYRVYSEQVTPDMNDRDLHGVLGLMLLELEDAHTHLFTPYGQVLYNFTEGYPENYDTEVIYLTYLNQGKMEQGGLEFCLLDSVGYIAVPDFKQEITDETMRVILDSLSDARGIIIDVRQNGGGNDRFARTLANHFFDKKRHVENRYYKTGTGHNDLGKVEFHFEPKQSLNYSKPTVVLTNRKCYSACNTFVCWMSMLPHVLIAGDITGGGGGTPHYTELPNGWTYRYSSNASFRPDGIDIDKGVPPDSTVHLQFWDLVRKKDTMIEFAIEYINSQEDI